MVIASAVPALAAPGDLGGVIDALRTWIVRLLVGLATFFLTVGAIRYLTADGDPGAVDQAKRGIRNALIGYGLAICAPLIVDALRSVVG
ncbi:hypothetical protein D5S17_14560 [Pseudonocardiaceae bacterium YIM PH 21723]|nr:hypothetical protein D5S17_14560 [Pseudonocardiaceae bacterium YIM PH 21723]